MDVLLNTLYVMTRKAVLRRDHLNAKSYRRETMVEEDVEVMDEPLLDGGNGLLRSWRSFLQLISRRRIETLRDRRRSEDTDGGRRGPEDLRVSIRRPKRFMNTRQAHSTIRTSWRRTRSWSRAA